MADSERPPAQAVKGTFGPEYFYRGRVFGVWGCLLIFGGGLLINILLGNYLATSPVLADWVKALTFTGSPFGPRIRNLEEFSPESVPYYLASLIAIPYVATVGAALGVRNFDAKNIVKLNMPDPDFRKPTLLGLLCLAMVVRAWTIHFIDDEIELGGVERYFIMPALPVMGLFVGGLIMATMVFLGCATKLAIFKGMSR